MGWLVPRTISRRGACLLAITMLLVACLPESPPLRRIGAGTAPAARAASGCWRLQGWAHVEERVPAGSIVLLDSVPDERRLASGDSSSFGVTIVPADSLIARRTSLSGWGIDAMDVTLVHLWIGDGFTGLGFRLRQLGDTMSGTVRRYVDYPSVAMRHDVRAVRVSCP